MKLVLLIVTLIALETTAIAQPSAEDLHAEGQAAYDRADYKAAVTKWQASYDLSKETGLLFNLAQAKRLSDDCADAIATYRRFIADDPDPTSEQHKLAEDLVSELEPRCGAAAPLSSTRDALPAGAPLSGAPLSSTRDALPAVAPLSSTRGVLVRPSSRRLRLAGLVTGGAGAITLATGLVFGRRASSLGDEVTRACVVSCDWTEQQDKDARGRRYAAVGRVLDGVGLAAIVAGATLYYLGSRESAVFVAPRPREGGAVVSWSGSW